MNIKTHKQNIVESAIKGLNQGGAPGSMFAALFERIYDCGYNEHRRENESLKMALDTWLEKTEWVQHTAEPGELGLHRADVLKQRIEQLTALLEKNS